MLKTRSEWVALKKKHGIPDGVCTFGMGERIDSWGKKIATAHGANDFTAKLAAIDGMLKDFRTYEAALKQIKPTKFSGKNLAEQTKNLKDTQAAVHTEVTQYETVRAMTETLANPLVTLKKNLTLAKSKLNGIAKTDLSALKQFYEKEYRNDCGLHVRNLALKTGAGKLKTALDNYLKTGELLNEMVDETAQNDLPKIAQIHAACKMGVEGLAIEVL